MEDTLINDVSDTALWVATYRAMESERPDALFHDRLAGKLTGERGRKIAHGMVSSKYTQFVVVVRTVIIDAFIKELLAQGIDTVVNLGCGLDTRPYRMDLPATFRWIEVDYPHMIQLKEERLKDDKPKCKLERFGIDLADLTARRELFAKIALDTKKALILTEGVVIYLTEEQTGSLADDLRKYKQFQYWVVDYLTPLAFRFIQRNFKRKQQMRNAPFLFNPPDWLGFFASRGWATREIRYMGVEGAKYGRTPPTSPWMKIFWFFTPAKFKEKMLSLSGYLLFEQK